MLISLLIRPQPLAHPGTRAHQNRQPVRQELDRLSSLRRSRYAAAVALPAPPRSANWISTPDPEGPEVRHLLMRVGMQHITSTRPTPDRFIYTVEYGDWRLTVPEQDLTPELRRLVQVVLNRGGG